MKNKLDMGNLTDDKAEELLAFVRAISRMTLHVDKPYDDTASELIAFDSLIRNARRLIGGKNV